jgi:hypothetical protein
VEPIAIATTEITKFSSVIGAPNDRLAYFISRHFSHFFVFGAVP